MNTSWANWWEPQVREQVPHQSQQQVWSVIKLPLLSFFSLFFLPIGYNKPFLCPHVTCQNHVSGSVRLCQALPASLQSTTGHTTVRLCQAHSSLALDHLPSFLRHLSCHSPSRSMSLSFAISLSHSVAYATLSQDGALRLLSLLSPIVPHLLILTPRHSLTFLHSFCLRISLTHVAPFLTCSRTLILVTI